MKSILLIGNIHLIDENVCFLLKLAGFSPVLVKSMEEAINLIEIKRSIESDFDLMILCSSELKNYQSEYSYFLQALDSHMKILLIDNVDNAAEHPLHLERLLKFENLAVDRGGDLLFAVKKLLDGVKTIGNTGADVISTEFVAT